MFFLCYRSGSSTEKGDKQVWNLRFTAKPVTRYSLWFWKWKESKWMGKKLMEYLKKKGWRDCVTVLAHWNEACSET